MMIAYPIRQKLETVTTFLTLDGIHIRIIVRSALHSESKLTLTDVMACSLEAESIYERISFVSPFKDFISQEEISVSMCTGLVKFTYWAWPLFPPITLIRFFVPRGTIWPFRSERVENFDGRSGNPVPLSWERLCSTMSCHQHVRTCLYSSMILWWLNSVEFLCFLWKWILKH